MLHRIDGVDTPALLTGPDLLAPVRATLAAAFAHRPPGSLDPVLVVPDGPGWLRADSLADGTRVGDLLASVALRRRATPHAAAALGWKAYTYALALPAVLGWASARRVPLLRPSDVVVRLDTTRSVLGLALRPTVRVAVLRSDPAVRHTDPADVVADEAALLARLRGTLLDAHLTPVLGHIRSATRIGSRTLLGSLASAVAHALLDAADALPEPVAGHAEALLGVLGVRDLVDLVPAPDGGLTVRRRTCCLAFTLPEAKVCASCCLRSVRPPPGGRRPFT
ncbi:IucA/IucC family C-terminal-domain containing protein [Actinoplanes sp. NPDC049316]|uniref:IucA/IucC family C-terminal-domain containing protein n=1 Tax=Actinoplanes sp. NPDC049316 TaxID=3154727 RepID=UPI0034378D1A